MIKFLNITQQDKPIKKRIIKNINNVIKKNNFILGDFVEKFEKDFALFCNSKFAISCANGTDALTIALRILDLPKNSEVIMPAMTYCSTAFSIINAGLKPILVDIDKFTSTISIKDLKKKITSKTKVVMPVHLYGSVVNIKQIKKIIKKKNIYIIDDCSQAHGATLDGKRVGSLADISCFSLYPGKNLGAYGDAGVITTNNKIFYNKIKNFRNLGSTVKFIHTQIGFNSRLDTLQASILIEKLKLLNDYNQKRRKIAAYYDKYIKNRKINKLKYSEGSVYHQYVIMVANKSKLINLFKKHNIQYGFHYPKSINQIDSLKNIFKKNQYINSENLAKKCFSIPIDPTLNKKQILKIVNVLNIF
jgi:dTDP-4-amino-4,6-dideoxygalactose transaminase